MSLTREELREELNDRFEHYEKRTVRREEKKHREIMTDFSETISSLSNHIDERLNRLEKLLSLDREVWGLNERLAELAKRTGNMDLADPVARPTG